MSRRAHLRRRRLTPFQAYYHTGAWKARRALVRTRAKGQCEYCGWKPMAQVHHRTYRHFGKEPLMDLMAVCRPCHRSIHRRGRQGKSVAGSLRARGDPGMGYPPMWRQYLARCKGEDDEHRSPSISLVG
jgi:5-methylcytosine-specific restriction endonuclease McrA